MHLLQRTLVKGIYAKLMAVRKVTQDNRGKKTPGVDGNANLDSTEKLNLAYSIHIGGEAKPIRRVYIPKPGKAEKRPLGIPTMRDRATQALAKLALEPE